jgi:mRNA interferase RelE/StbE
MAWTLRFASGVDQDMRRLDRTDARFIIDSLQRFVAGYDAVEPALIKSGKIKRLKGEWAGFFRLRLRTYRVTYRKYKKTLVIFVVRVSHRREAYRP